MTLSQGKLSRRAFLSAGVTAASGTGAALVFGCGGGGPSATQAPSASSRLAAGPRTGGQITIARLLSAFSLDPHTDETAADITELIYSRLYRWDSVSQIAIFNDLATAVEIPDPDHSQFIVHLRPGVKIHSDPGNPGSGGEITSNDCKQSFIRHGTSITASDKRLSLLVSGTNSPDGGALGAALQTPDPLTFSFKLSRPFVPAFYQLAKPEWAIIPAKVIEKYGGSFSGPQALFGSGPFMLDEFRGTERIVLVRHPEYFLSPRPWLDRIAFEVESSHASQISGLEAGRYDAIAASIGRDKYRELKEDARFTASRTPTLFNPSLHLRIRPPFDDVRVREAIDLALDRQKFIDAIWGGEGNYNGPVAWPLAQWVLPQDELRRLYPNDPARARALLEEAGYADGFATQMTIPSAESSAVFDIREAASRIVADLSQIGVTVTIDQVDLGSFVANVLVPGNFEMAFSPNLPYDEPDRPLAFYTTRGITGVGNWNNYTNPEIDGLVEAQAQEFAQQRRRDIIYEAQRLMIKEHGPQITLPSGYEYHAHLSRVHYPYEAGEAPSPGAGPWGADIWTEAA